MARSWATQKRWFDIKSISARSVTIPLTSIVNALVRHQFLDDQLFSRVNENSRGVLIDPSKVKSRRTISAMNHPNPHTTTVQEHHQPFDLSQTAPPHHLHRPQPESNTTVHHQPPDLNNRNTTLSPPSPAHPQNSNPHHQPDPLSDGTSTRQPGNPTPYAPLPPADNHRASHGLQAAKSAWQAGRETQAIGLQDNSTGCETRSS